MILSRFKLLARAAIFMIPVLTGAAVSHADTLEDAVIMALNHHPNVEAAMANRNAYSEERREQWADYYPTLNIRAAAGRVFSDNSTSRGLQVTRDSAYSYMGEGAVTLTQPIFDGFETTSRVQAADFRRMSADYNIADIRERLILATVIAYMDVLRADETLARLQDYTATIKDYQSRIRAMVEQGAADETQWTQALDIEAQLQNTITNTEGQRRKAEAQYAELVGKMPERPMTRPVGYRQDIPVDINEAVAFARESHPLLRAASLTENALLRDAEAEKQFYYPDINGELSYLKRDQAEEIGGEVEDAKAVIRLNWDISMAGGQMARVRKNMQRHYEGKAQRVATERQIERDVRMAYGEMQTAIDQMGILRDRVTINEDLFRNYQAQFEGARISLLQLLQSENALFNARLAQLNGEYRILASEFAALAGMGRLQQAMNIVPVKARKAREIREVREASEGAHRTHNVHDTHDAHDRGGR